MTNPVLDFCLLIPCYNNFAGLIESLESVHYPADKYLVVIVDDGSEVPLKEEKIKSMLNEIKPFIVLSNQKNEGITHTLNKGLAWIEKNTSSKYIARLDCGDTCSIDRFTEQVAYMNLHPDTGLLGSWCRFINKQANWGYSYTTPTAHEDLLRAMHFRNVFIHPTVMFRVSLLAEVGYYPSNFPHAEDYALFWKLLIISRSHNVPKLLVTSEINIKGISYKNRRSQLISRYKVLKTFSKSRFLRMLGFARLIFLYILPKGLILRLKQSG